MYADMDFSELPPGFGFHPTDVELISHYLKRKIMGVKDGFDMIPEVDIYKHEPWDLPAKSGMSCRESKWHFFNMRDRKYPNGMRSNRATGKGYWKSTGKDRTIQSRNRNIGTKKTLVFHEGRPPMGKRTDWIMHEYYLEDKECRSAGTPKDSFVLCRITKRNGFPSTEECFPVAESNDSSTPQFHANPLETLESSTQPKMQKEEDSILPQVKDEVEDYELWFEELYDDPEFPEFPKRMDAGSNLDFGSIVAPPIVGGEASLLALEQQDVVGCGRAFKDSTGGWSGFQDMEFQPTLLDLPEYRYETSSTRPESMEIEEKTRMTRGEVENVVEEDTGIVRRRRAGCAAGDETLRMKLQVRKMETRKPEVSNHVVMLDETIHQLDSDDSLLHVCSPSFGKKEWQQPMIDNWEATNITGIASSELEVEEEEGYAYGKCDVKDERAWQEGVKRSMSGAFKEARSLVRRCSSFGPSCLLVGTVLLGAATITARCCYHEEDS